MEAEEIMDSTSFNDHLLNLLEHGRLLTGEPMTLRYGSGKIQFHKLIAEGMEDILKDVQRSQAAYIKQIRTEYEANGCTFDRPQMIVSGSQHPYPSFAIVLGQLFSRGTLADGAPMTATNEAGDLFYCPEIVTFARMATENVRAGHLRMIADIRAKLEGGGYVFAGRTRSAE
jgi:hypothetical protein